MLFSDPPVIVSASRRTDIPAFYMDWMLEQLRGGAVFSRNPYNPAQTRRVELTPESGCIVFWSKNPAPLLERIDRLESFRIPFGILFTLNPYGKELEPGVPPVEERIATFRELSRRIGKEKMIWRYDPICFSPQFDDAFHRSHFEKLATSLSDATGRCITSFLDFYAKTIRNTVGHELYDPPQKQKNSLATELAAIAHAAGIRLEACAESGTPLPPAACIGTEWIRDICGQDWGLSKDSGQRELCHCAKSVDIGMPDSCPHGCSYCYANRSPQFAKKNKRHGFFSLDIDASKR